MELLTIAIDPGFDSLKVVANGIVFKVPFNIVETDERKFSDYALTNDFLLYKSPMSVSYRVGQYAREIVSFDSKLNSEEGMAKFYSEERFVSDEFAIGLDTVIAMAVEKTGCYNRLSQIEIHIVVALPHSCKAKFADTVKGILDGEHDFKLKIGDGEEKNYRFSIKGQNIRTISQTIAAILGETSNDEGYVDSEKAQYLSEGPTLVLDGGYYTMGMVAIFGGGTVNEDLTGSDKSHAMKNINMAVAKAVSDVRPDIKHYMIEYLIKKDGGKVRAMVDGKMKVIDLTEIKKEKTAEIAQSLIELLNEKYNFLLPFKYVVVTGGTGACLYKHLFEYYNEAEIFDRDHFLLTDSPLEGIQHSIEFAIAAGAYKGLKASLT